MKQTPKLALHVETVRVLNQASDGEARQGNRLTQSSCLPRCTCPPALEG